MRFGKLTALTGVLLMSLAIMFGCSDDKSTPPPVITYGSLDDPEFVPVKTEIENVLGDIVSGVVSGLDNLYLEPGDTSTAREQLTPPLQEPDPDADPDILITIYENGWHFVYAEYTSDAYFAKSADSIRYEVDGIPVEHLTSGIDYIHYIDNWKFTALDQEISHSDFTGRNDFELEHLDQNVAVLNGNTVNTIENVYVGSDTSMTNVFSFTIDIHNINVTKIQGLWACGCPQSGTLDMTLTHVFNWSNDQTFGVGSSNWTVHVVYDDGTATITADNGDQTWRYECQICTVLSL